MPISSVGSYLSTMQEFITHWTSVNAALGGTAATDLKLSGNYTLGNLTTDRTNIQTQMDVVESAVAAQRTAAGNRDVLRISLRIRLTEFRASVNFQLRGSGYIKALPALPPKAGSETRTIHPFAAMLQIWTQINADTTVPGFTAPLLLVGNYTLANFTADLAALRAIYITFNANGELASISRKKRIVATNPIKRRLTEYRNAVLAKFGPGAALVLSLPAVSPASGSTPKPPENLKGVWNATMNKAVITFDASPSMNIKKYSLRSCVTMPYKVADEYIVDTLDADAIPLEFDTEEGLITAGAKRTFRVYTVTNDDNEKGSPNITITRP